MFLIGDNRAAENIAMSGEIFRETVHDHVRAQFQRTHHQGRRKRAVYNQRRTAPRAQSSQAHRSRRPEAAGWRSSP